MLEEFKNMLLKKQKEQQKSPVDKEKLKAKANMMKELSSLLSKDMAGDMGGLKKVTVASDSKEGLQEGLEKAKDVIEKKPSMGDMLEGMNERAGESKDDMEEEEMDESPEHESSEQESEDSVEDEIKKLEEKLAELKAKKA